MCLSQFKRIERSDFRRTVNQLPKMNVRRLHLFIIAINYCHYVCVLRSTQKRASSAAVEPVT